MKTFLIAASLIVGTAAIAQTTPDATMPAQAAPAATPDATMPAPAPAPDAMAATPAPSAGMNAMPAPTTADMSTYPPCSRTVHDHCVQTHEMARKHR